MTGRRHSQQVPGSRSAFGVEVERNVMVPMRDGVLLATDVYCPDRGPDVSGESSPTLLLRTPYGKGQIAEHSGWPRRFARQDYVVVVQDSRGCFDSQGEVDFLWPEADDGFDTVAWIRAQPWSNGLVGTWGTSWCGWTQTALAAAGAEGVAAMVPVQSGASAHSSSVRHNGALELRWIAWAFWHAAANTQAALKRDATVDAALSIGAPAFSDWLTRWPIRPEVTPLAQVRAYQSWALELMTAGDYNERWQHPSVNPLAHLETFTDAPTLLLGGWYDSYARSTLELFQGLNATKHGPIKVVMGPWSHGEEAIEQPFAGDAWFGRAAAIDLEALHLRWYDRWMKGADNGVDAEPPLQIFVMGGGPGTRAPGGRLHHGGHWRDEDEWPLARARSTPYYLHADGGLRTDASSALESSTTFAFNPSNPVPTIGGGLSSLLDANQLPPRVANPTAVHFLEGIEDLTPVGGHDQRERPGLLGQEPPFLPLASRPDVLVFQTEPLESDIEVTGPIAVQLWVASSAVDTDVTAKLIDVYPPSESFAAGYALNLTDSILRLRYRDDPRTPKWLTPGEAVSAEITLYPTSNLFAAGHRIRLDISSSNFPRFDVNPNTGEPLGKERRRNIADNTIFHDAERPSHVVLPIVPSA